MHLIAVICKNRIYNKGHLEQKKGNVGSHRSLWLVVISSFWRGKYLIYYYLPNFWVYRSKLCTRAAVYADRRDRVCIQGYWDSVTCSECTLLKAAHAGSSGCWRRVQTFQSAVCLLRRYTWRTLLQDYYRHVWLKSLPAAKLAINSVHREFIRLRAHVCSEA